MKTSSESPIDAAPNSRFELAEVVYILKAGHTPPSDSSFSWLRQILANFSQCKELLPCVPPARNAELLAFHEGIQLLYKTKPGCSFAAPQSAEAECSVLQTAFLTLSAKVGFQVRSWSLRRPLKLTCYEILLSL